MEDKVELKPWQKKVLEALEFYDTELDEREIEVEIDDCHRGLTVGINYQ